MANTLKLGAGKWATGTDTVLAFNDENNNFKPLPFDFSRASSATVVNQSGLIETVGSGTPRIDFQGNTKGAMLLEPSRTNLIENSYLFNSFTFGRSTKTLESGINPDGTTDVVLMSATSGTGGTHRAYSNSISVVSGTTYTISLFVKKGTSSKIQFDLLSGGEGGIGFGGSIFDFNNETITKGSFEVFNDDWYHLKSTGTVSTTTSTSRMFLYVYDENGNKSFSANGTENMNLFGAQLEQGSSATSYIPTSGSAVTRVGEEVNNQNNLMSGLTDMAMFVDYKLPNEKSSGFRNQLGFRDNNNANFYMIQFPNSSTHEFRYTGVANVNVDMTPSMSEQDFGLRRKLLYTKTGTTLKVFCNGVQVTTVTSASATTFSTTSEILNAGSNYDIEMKIKDWKLYNNGFTDAEAIALTTI